MKNFSKICYCGESRLIFFNESNESHENNASTASDKNETPQEQKETPITPESVTNAPHTIADVLKATEAILGKDIVWDLPNGADLEKILPQLRSELGELNNVLESRAGLGVQGVRDINKFLEQKGFSIRLDENQANEITISAASVLKLEGEWHGEHAPKKIEEFKLESTKEVPAVKFKKVNSYTIEGHKYPIIELKTFVRPEEGFREGDPVGPVVCVTRFDGDLPGGASGLYSMTSDWIKKLKGKKAEKVNATVPMIDYQKSGDISELLQGSTTGKDGLPAVIDQAIFEHILKMNEKGFLAKAAAAVMMSRGIDISASREVNIDGPFVMWVEQRGVNAFSAYISEDDMKDPGNFQEKND